MRRSASPVFLAAFVLLMPTLFLPLAARRSGQAAQGPGSRAPLVVDIAISERDGAPVTGLGASDFVVMVDGKPARVVALRQVFRGPGSLVWAAQYGRQPGATGTPSTAWAETSRAIVIAIDTYSLARGDEKATALAAGHLLDRLGPDDRIAVMTLPYDEGPVALSADPPAHRGALVKVAAHPWSLEVREPKMTADEALAIARGNRQALRAVLQRYETVPENERPNETAIEADAVEVLRQAREHAAETVREVRDIAAALGPIPGRKTILLLSQGALVDSLPAEIDQAVHAAIDARTAVYVVRLPASRDLEVQALESLARQTGGVLLPLVKNSDQALDKLARELSSLYELTLEPQPDPGSSSSLGRITLATSRKGVEARASAWARPREATADAGLAQPSDQRPPAGAARAPGTLRPQAEPVKSGDVPLFVVLGRASEHLAAYLREFSAAVAEERYEQTVRAASSASTAQGSKLPSKRVLRSDFLFVRTAGEDGWLQFRDVFEVDGSPVRDRQERLQKLFIERPATAVDEATTIGEESARYNIGPVKRTIFPTEPLRFLEPANRERFTFSKRRQETVEGVQAWRVDYTEKVRPTIIQTPGQNPQDVLTDGAFWIDPVTGRVLKTQLNARTMGWPSVALEMTVTYRPNASLGIWMPAEMKEKYDYSGGTILGAATYSNFRRFVVTTEEKLKIPK
jgi:VWFA-related protein